MYLLLLSRIIVDATLMYSCAGLSTPLTSKKSIKVYTVPLRVIPEFLIDS